MSRIKGNVNSGRLEGVVTTRPSMTPWGLEFELRNQEPRSTPSGAEIIENIFKIVINDFEVKRLAEKTIDQGDRIIVTFKLGSRQYTTKQGEIRYMFYLRVGKFSVEERGVFLPNGFVPKATTEEKRDLAKNKNHGKAQYEDKKEDIDEIPF